MTNKWKLSQAEVRGKSSFNLAKHQLANSLRQLTFLYSYHKSAFARLSIASVHDFPKWGLIASIQLNHLISSSFQLGCSTELQTNLLAAQMSSSSCNRWSILQKLGRCCGNCESEVGKNSILILNCRTQLCRKFIYLNAIWCHCKSNKFNLTANISDVASFSCTTFMPFSIKLIVRLDCLLFDLRDIRCWFDHKSSWITCGFETC